MVKGRAVVIVRIKGNGIRLLRIMVGSLPGCSSIESGSFSVSRRDGLRRLPSDRAADLASQVLTGDRAHRPAEDPERDWVTLRIILRLWDSTRGFRGTGSRYRSGAKRPMPFPYDPDCFPDSGRDGRVDRGVCCGGRPFGLEWLEPRGRDRVVLRWRVPGSGDRE